MKTTFQDHQIEILKKLGVYKTGTVSDILEQLPTYINIFNNPHSDKGWYNFLILADESYTYRIGYFQLGDGEKHEGAIDNLGDITDIAIELYSDSLSDGLFEVYMTYLGKNYKNLDDIENNGN